MHWEVARRDRLQGPTGEFQDVRAVATEIMARVYSGRQRHDTNLDLDLDLDLNLDLDSDLISPASAISPRQLDSSSASAGLSPTARPRQTLPPPLPSQPPLPLAAQQSHRLPSLAAS
ncbi:hypothetical protein G7Z17_g11732 [Cylindrodendrum hubeiense]|uniref:Uncharacterized protein n=1 Tax=Cylindrodendrum hubeiense TaxID=595255 RepID=A0A9P5GVD6_9HYPO|nr:hypothetical protein G7Z17_g11732 [Cylindrodendrum hubeiense]